MADASDVVLALSTLASLMALGAPGPKQGPDVLLLPLQAEGRLSAPLVKRLEARLAEQLPGAEPAMCAAPCDPHALAMKRGAFVVVSRMVRDGRDYQVSATLIEPGRGVALVQAESTCEICGIDAVATRLDDVAARVRDKLELVRAAPTRLSIESTPPGALVTCGGTSRGETPVEFDIEPGAVDCRVESPGFETGHLEFAVVAGTTEHAAVQLQASPPPPRLSASPVADARPKLDRRRARRRTAGWATLGIGTAALVASIPLYVLHHRPVQSRCGEGDIDVNGLCRYRYVTLNPAIAVSTVAVTTLAVAVGLLVSSRRGRKHRKRSDVAALGFGRLMGRAGAGVPGIRGRETMFLKF